MPHIWKIKSTKNLWELWVKHSSNIFRIFFFTIKNDKFVLLHGFRKKTNKTPKKELNIAIKRMLNYIEKEVNKHES
jgi:phage-related protein